MPVTKQTYKRMKVQTERRFDAVITLPVHNEIKFLPDALICVRHYASKLFKNYVVVIAEDGSTDGTAEFAMKKEKEYSNVKVLHEEKKLGRGRALKNAWRAYDADIYLFIDADIATDMDAFPTLVGAIKKGYDLATGSRYMVESKVNRPTLRLAVSKMYNLFVRTLFRDGIHDHQCGFKGFSRRLVKDIILSECVHNDWFWDTEVIVLATLKGYRIFEFGVSWEEKRRNKTSLKRLISDIAIHGAGLLNLYRRMLNHSHHRL